MLICGECGSLFERARTIVERHGLNTPPYEELLVCPCCGETSIFPACRCDLCGEWITGEYIKTLDGDRICGECYTEIRHLYIPAAPAAKVKLSCSHEHFAPLAANDRLRRAFSKAMRDCFQWPGELVRLSPDGGAHFYFTTRSGFPACGGLILHEGAVKTPHGNRQKLFYSIHT